MVAKHNCKSADLPPRKIFSFLHPVKDNLGAEDSWYVQYPLSVWPCVHQIDWSNHQDQGKGTPQAHSAHTTTQNSRTPKSSLLNLAIYTTYQEGNWVQAWSKQYEQAGWPDLSQENLSFASSEKEDGLLRSGNWLKVLLKTKLSLLLSHALTMASLYSVTIRQSPWQPSLLSPSSSHWTQEAFSLLSLLPSWFHLHSSAIIPLAHILQTDKMALSPPYTYLLIPI